jgi:hypothetical protein
MRSGVIYIIPFSFVLATYGEPVNAALWRDILWRL